MRDSKNSKLYRRGFYVGSQPVKNRNVDTKIYYQKPIDQEIWELCILNSPFVLSLSSHTPDGPMQEFLSLDSIRY
ncbi:13196_t:CDS:2 [Rhizophagus irregularis]|nr:13196_t:CDS:2 [Rhizophagus irregularis]